MDRSFSRMAVAMVVLAALAPVSGLASEAAAFRIQEDAETLSDLKPLMLSVSREAPPDISPQEAFEHHQSLLQEVSDASVRVALVERLGELQRQGGGELALSDEQEQALYRDVLPDYQTLIDEGGYHADRPVLFYQAARAASLAGESAASVDFLETLTEEHRESELAPEASFRIAEHHFSEGDHALAESAYEQVLELGPDGQYAPRALYMRGWSEFLQDRHQEAGDTFISVLDRHYDSESGFDHLSMGAEQQVQDTFRILSIISAYSGGATALNELLERHPDRGYAPALYERLAVFYRDKARFRDSVAAAESFLEDQPGHEQAPVLAGQAIQSWSAGQYHEQQREAQAEFVAEYGDGEWPDRLKPEQRQQLLDYADALGRWHYQQGQGAESTESRESEYEQAADYLEQWLKLAGRDDYPAPDQQPQTEPGEVRMLAGDAAQQSGDLERAAVHYQRAAYANPDFEDAREAGYALIQLRRDQWESESSSRALEKLIGASRRYIGHFAETSETADIRQALANTLYQEDRFESAIDVARELVAMEAADADHRRAGWTVLGHAAQEQKEFAIAENAYGEALERMDDDDERRPELRERLGVAVYSQGEAAAERDRVDEALEHYERVGDLAPETEVAVSAAFDHGALLLQAGRWERAIVALNGFTGQHGDHELAGRVPEMLVHAYTETGDQSAAASQLLSHQPEEESDSAYWQRQLRAAGYYRQGDDRDEAISLYEAYFTDGTDHFGDHEFQQERRRDLSELYSNIGDSDSASDWHQRLLEAEEETAGTPRSQHLAGESALQLGREAADEVAAIALEAPLEESLGQKRDALQGAVAYLQQAESYGFAETVTESTWRMGELYRELAQDVLDSERPEGLTDLQAEQYEMLLEEEAYPFEEQAIDLHQRNQRRIQDGHWTSWVGRSLEALAEIYPARYERDTRWMEARYEQ